MLKYVDYTLLAGDAVIERGVAHRTRLEYLIREGVDKVELTPIDDEAYQALVDAWGGATVEPLKLEAKTP